jgi:hypothetical protein
LEDPVAYILILALISLPLVLLVWYVTEIMFAGYSFQSLMFAFPFV